ncbi:MAG: hypothetical protein ACC609_04655 [Methanobacterium formicicum]
MTDKNKYKLPYIRVPDDWQFLRSWGPGPFITRAIFKTPAGEIVSWTSRYHRKHHFNLEIRRGSTWLAPGAVGWWIGVLFAIGSICFALGSVHSYASYVGIFTDNLTYFIGSIFFTTAGFLQFLETASAPQEIGGIKSKLHFMFFQPSRIDWWSAAIQSLGTIFFNISTFAAIISTLSASQAELFVWSPDLYGSICFLVSSYLIYIEIGHKFFSLHPQSLSWWIVFLNLVGSVAFGVSAVGAFIPFPTDQPFNPFLMNMGTFIGAVCFFAAAVLLLPERTINLNKVKNLSQN